MDEDVDKNNYTYYNAKEMIEPSEIPPTEQTDYEDEEFHDKKDKKPPIIIHLTESAKFLDSVNFSVSSVHVPANVYDGGEYDVLNKSSFTYHLLIFQRVLF
jgi:voltage-dependent calcium channel alpha-2/delta-3